MYYRQDVNKPVRRPPPHQHVEHYRENMKFPNMSKKEGKLKRWQWLLIVLLVLAVLGFVVFMVLRNRNKGGKTGSAMMKIFG